ncbi:hypothetical protein V1514DRAFT_324359 [Lipomyces japonicus]|uniref:uncharacterized protein n=1 Tax=Lipomyces japonicus TaxID=56871 RepID=UPI0034CF83A7
MVRTTSAEFPAPVITSHNSTLNSSYYDSIVNASNEFTIVSGLGEGVLGGTTNNGSSLSAVISKAITDIIRYNDSTGIQKTVNWTTTKQKAKVFWSKTVVVGAAVNDILQSINNTVSIASSIMKWVSFSNKVSTDQFEVCNTYSWSGLKVGGDSYDIEAFIYTVSKNECNMQHSTAVEWAIRQAFEQKPVAYDTGDCLTLFNSESSVMYIKRRREGSNTSYGEIYCARVNGWGAPSPYYDSYQLYT